MNHASTILMYLASGAHQDVRCRVWARRHQYPTFILHSSCSDLCSPPPFCSRVPGPFSPGPMLNNKHKKWSAILTSMLCCLVICVFSDPCIPRMLPCPAASPAPAALAPLLHWLSAAQTRGIGSLHCHSFLIPPPVEVAKSLPY